MSAELMRYRVLRGHDGDRWYGEGETRVARSDDVQHLVGKVLEPLGPAVQGEGAKSDPAPNNKADPPPNNKADKSTKTRKQAAKKRG